MRHTVLLAAVFAAAAAGTARADLVVPPEERCEKAGDSCRGGRGRCESAGFECQAGSCRQHGDEGACQKAGCSWQEQFSCRDTAPPAPPAPTSPTAPSTSLATTSPATTAPVPVPAPAGCAAVDVSGLAPFFAFLVLAGLRRRR